MSEASGLGRFFIGVQVPPGNDDVEARGPDGGTYVSGEMPLGRSGMIMTTITP